MADHADEDPKQGDSPKLTASEQRMIAELDRIKNLISDGIDKEDEALTAAYRLTVRVYDLKKRAYKPRFQKLLDKLKFKARAASNNPLLRIAEYVSGGKMRGARKTRFGQALAAGLHYHGDPVALARDGGQEKLIRAYKEDAGLLKAPKSKKKRKFPTTDLSNKAIEPFVQSGEPCLAIITFLPSGEVHVEKVIAKNDPAALDFLGGNSGDADAIAAQIKDLAERLEAERERREAAEQRAVKAENGKGPDDAA
jgi:hypothetical protein